MSTQAVRQAAAVQARVLSAAGDGFVPTVWCANVCAQLLNRRRACCAVLVHHT